MRTSTFSALVGAVCLSLGGSVAFGGFSAVLGPTNVTGTTVLTTTNPGKILSYTPDGPSDPQITGGDLDHFHVTFPGLTFVAPVGVTPGSLIGTYNEYYDLTNNGLDAGDPSISMGTVNFTVTNAAIGDGSYSLDGRLAQTAGPTNPAFADITYGNPLNTLSFTGFYRPQIAVPEISGVIIQSVPEAGAMWALPAVGLLARRRR